MFAPGLRSSPIRDHRPESLMYICDVDGSLSVSDRAGDSYQGRARTTTTATITQSRRWSERHYEARERPGAPLAIDPGSLDQSTRIPSRCLCTFRWILGGGSTRAKGWQTAERMRRERRRWRRDRFTCCFDVNTDIPKHNLMMPSQPRGDRCNVHPRKADCAIDAMKLSRGNNVD